MFNPQSAPICLPEGEQVPAGYKCVVAEWQVTGTVTAAVNIVRITKCTVLPYKNKVGKHQLGLTFLSADYQFFSSTPLQQLHYNKLSLQVQRRFYDMLYYCSNSPGHLSELFS